jgi:hypothetical protein
MSWTGPNPASTPNPMNPPPLPHNRQEGGSNLLDAKWFLIGVITMFAIIGAFTIWVATSSPSAELDYELLEIEIRHGAVQDLTISGTELTGNFNDTRQSYDGEVRGRNEPVPAGYTESDARAVTSFTTTIPDGERENLIALAEEHQVSITVE